MTGLIFVFLTCESKLRYIWLHHDANATEMDGAEMKKGGNG